MLKNVKGETMKTIKVIARSFALFIFGFFVMPLVPFLLAYWNWQDRDCDAALDVDDDDEQDNEEEENEGS